MVGKVARFVVLSLFLPLPRQTQPPVLSEPYHTLARCLCLNDSNPNLVVATVSITESHDWLHHRPANLLLAWEPSLVFGSRSIEITLVNTNPQLTILFDYRNNSSKATQHTWPYEWNQPWAGARFIPSLTLSMTPVDILLGGCLYGKHPGLMGSLCSTSFLSNPGWLIRWPYNTLFRYATKRNAGGGNPTLHPLVKEKSLDKTSVYVWPMKMQREDWSIHYPISL